MANSRRPVSSSRRLRSTENIRSFASMDSTEFPEMRQSVVSFPADDGVPTSMRTRSPRKTTTSMPVGQERPRSLSKVSMKSLTARLRMSVATSPVVSSEKEGMDENDGTGMDGEQGDKHASRKLSLSKSIGALRSRNGGNVDGVRTDSALQKGKGKASERESRTLRQRFSSTSLRRSAATLSPPLSPPLSPFISSAPASAHPSPTPHSPRSERHPSDAPSASSPSSSQTPLRSGPSSRRSSHPRPHVRTTLSDDTTPVTEIAPRDRPSRRGSPELQQDSRSQSPSLNTSDSTPPSTKPASPIPRSDSRDTLVSSPRLRPLPVPWESPSASPLPPARHSPVFRDSITGQVVSINSTESSSRSHSPSSLLPPHLNDAAQRPDEHTLTSLIPSPLPLASPALSAPPVLTSVQSTAARRLSGLSGRSRTYQTVDLPTKTIDVRKTRRRSYFPTPLASPDLPALSESDSVFSDAGPVTGLGLTRRPPLSPRTESEAHELALAKLEGRQMVLADMSEEVALLQTVEATGISSRRASKSPPRRSSLLSASTSSARGTRAPYAPRPLLLPAYSNAQRRSAGLPPLTACSLPSISSSQRRSGGFRTSPTKTAAFRHPLYGAGRRLQWLNQLELEEAKRSERRRRKEEREAELAQLSLFGGPAGLGGGTTGDDDAWTWVDSEEGSEDDGDVGKKKKDHRVSRWHGDDLDGDPTVIWRASLDIGRRINSSRRAFGKGPAHLSQSTARPPSLSTLSSHSTNSQLPLPGHVALRSASSNRSKSSTGSVLDQRLVRARPAGTLASNAGFQALLAKIWAAWRIWSPRQRARALFSYGILGGMLGGLVMAAVKAQLGIASGLSPVTIAFFPTLGIGARGATEGLVGGLDRTPGFFLGVGLFLRGR